MAENNEQSFEKAVTLDWKNAYQRDLESMSPVQKFALKQAWDEVQSKTPERVANREISRMGRDEYDKYVSNTIYEAELAKARK